MFSAVRRPRLRSPRSSQSTRSPALLRLSLLSLCLQSLHQRLFFARFFKRFHIPVRLQQFGHAGFALRRFCPFRQTFRLERLCLHRTIINARRFHHVFGIFRQRINQLCFKRRRFVVIIRFLRVRCSESQLIHHVQQNFTVDFGLLRFGGFRRRGARW